MASSTAFFCSLEGAGVSGVGLLSMGLGVGGGGIDRVGGKFTGVGCW